MSLISSIHAFLGVLQEDGQLVKLGGRRGELLWLHYKGRWQSRFGTQVSSQILRFSLDLKQLDLELTAGHEGAFKGVFFDNEYSCSHRLSDSPQRILDLGANIGMAAIHLGTQFPEAEFICVEPDPRNIKLLERNLHVNGIKGAICQAAVGANTGTLNLRFGNDPTCSALETSPMHDLDQVISVEVRTVPQLMIEANWDRIDLLKIDIEGTEDELLSQNNDWLSNVGALILEIHPNTTPEKIASYLHPFGFKLERLGNGQEPVYLALR